MAIPLNIGNLLEQSGILPQQQQQLGAGNVDLQSLLNVKPPSLFNAPIGQMMMPDAQSGGSSFGYAPAFQPSTPYSANNLPEFMQGYEQTPSGRFVMSQGLLGVPPTMDKVQSLFSQGYSSEYDPLEKQFQESFAVDPSWFGNVYRSGYMIPSVPRGMTEDTSSPLGGIAGVLAGGAALKALTPFTDDIASSIGLGGKGVSSGTGLGTFLKDIDLSSSGTGIGTWFKENFNKPEFVNKAQEKAKEYIAKIKESDLYKAGQTAFDVGGDAFVAYGRIENFVKNPNPTDAMKAIDAMGKLTNYLPTGMQDELSKITNSIAPATGVALDASAIASLVNAFKDPTAQNIGQAYGSLNYLAEQGYLGADLQNVGGASSLPYANQIAGITNIIGGLQALEGGIDSAGEALQVATGAATAASMFGGGTAIGSAGTAALPVLGPIAALYGAFQVLNKPEANLGHAIVGRDDFGGYSISSEGYKGEGESIAKPEANAAMLVLGELERNYGYKFNPDAWEQVNKRVDFNNGRWERGAHDVIIDALQKGALVPTEGTPRSLDFVNMLNDARTYMSDAQYTTNKSMSSYARGQERARQMQASEAYGPEGPHPLEVQRMKMGLDPFQWSADIGEAFGRIDASKLDFSGLPQIDTSAYQPAQNAQSYMLGGQQYTPDQLGGLFGGVSIPTPFAGFTAPSYG